MVSVDVCLCTRRRPALLREALAALVAAERPAGARLRVVLVENDAVACADRIAEEVLAGSGIDLVYRLVSEPNISVARNACLEAADADWIAFVDDDETVDRRWLDELLNTAEAEQADAVFGPVRAVYPEDAPRWAPEADLHSARPVVVNGVIRTGYTSNVLIRRKSLRGLTFDPGFGRTGGEDTAFFAELHRRGGRLAFAPDAPVYERATPERLTLAWVLKRRFRSGQTHADVFGEPSLRSLRGLREAGAAAAKLAVCAAGSALFAAQPARRARWLSRGALHLGVLARYAGRPVLQLY